MPDEAEKELEEWQNRWRALKEAQMNVFNLEHHLESKTLAMQGAGLIESQPNLDEVSAMIADALNAPGLPLRVLMS